MPEGNPDTNPTCTTDALQNFRTGAGCDPRVTLASDGPSGLTAAPMVRLGRDFDDCNGCGNVFLRALARAQGRPRGSGENRPGDSANRRRLFRLQIGGRP